MLLVDGLINFNSLVNFVGSVPARIEFSGFLGEDSASSFGILVLGQLSLVL